MAPASATPVAVSGAPIVVLVLDGIRAGRRMTFLVNGKRRDLQDALFYVVLRAAAERARKSEAYVSSRELRITHSREIPSRIRKELSDAVPEGFSILQRSEEGFRLHPLVSVEGIAWEALERDSNAVVQALAVAERRRREG